MRCGVDSILQQKESSTFTNANLILIILRISVRLGEWDLSQDPDCEEGICAHSILNMGVENVIAHPNYKPNSKNQENDIALIRLNRNIIFTDWIKPICLPVEPRLRNANYDGVGLQVLGWGFTSSARDGELVRNIIL